MSYIHDIRRKHLKEDRLGGIEGLPMELLIILVVASVGIALIIGWMGNLDDNVPLSYGDVSSDVTMITVTDNGYVLNGGTEVLKEFPVDITVTDSAGDGIRDAVVKLSGLGIRGTMLQGLTDQSGNILFEGLTLMNRPSGSIGYVIASVSSDLGEAQVRIPVVVA